MAASCCTCCIISSTIHLNNTSIIKSSAASTLLNDRQICFFLRRRRRSNLQTPSNKNLVVRNATPEAATAAVDVLSSFSLTGGIPGISLAGDNPLLAGAAGLFVVLPMVVQRLLTLTKEVDMAAQAVEKIADAVEKVAEEVDKAAEGIAAGLPEGGLKKVVRFVEVLAEETAKDAQKVEDLMDKVEELDDKVEEFLNNKFNGTGKA
ncbi:hypothetical protein ABFX02_01G086400 [Erythranthe guttata]